MLGLLLLAPRWAAGDEARPSFDCAQAATVIDRMICGDPRLAEADRKLADTYARVQRELSPESFATAREAQRAWLPRRGACTQGIKIAGEKLSAEEASQCLVDLYERQGYLIDIPVKPLGGLTLEGRVRTRKWRRPDTDESDVYPWLVGSPAAKPAAFNQAILKNMHLDTHPFAQAGFDNEPGLHFDFDRSYQLHHVDARLISLEMFIHHEGNIGHGWQEQYTVNWDLAHDRPLDLDALFADGKWKAAIVAYALDDVKDAVQDPGSLIYEASVDDPSAWVFDDDGAVIRFGHGERSMAGASAEVTIPYDVLEPYLRPDAPLPLH
jgi:uncharacterized protein YecT (DUF1311 family)